MSTREPKKIVKIVVPGQRVATIEECIVKSGAYEDRDGNIRSLFCGTAVIDAQEKELTVSPIKPVEIVKVGDGVLARVFNMVSSYGFATIFAVKRDGDFEPLGRTFTGVIHPPRKDVSKVYKLGDYVYASVVSTKNRIFHLGLGGRSHGVVKALCPYCGQMLIKAGVGRLMCKKCGLTEPRKISPLYGKVI